MLSIVTKFQALTARESGQTVAEYSVVLAVVSLGVVAALLLLSGAISGALGTISDAL